MNMDTLEASIHDGASPSCFQNKDKPHSLVRIIVGPFHRYCCLNLSSTQKGSISLEKKSYPARHARQCNAEP